MESQDAFLIGAIVLGLMAVLGCVIGCVDYCWAPEGEKFGPKCQGPRSGGDFFLAVVGILIKGAFLLLVSEPMLTTVVEDFGGFLIYLLFLVVFSVLMCTIYLPITCSKTRCPTMKEVSQQFRAEKLEVADGRWAYVKKNFKQFLMGCVKMPCLLCYPQKFVTTGKALAVLVFVEILGGMCLMLYILIRILVSGYTYKLFTFKGWADEVIDIMKIKRRVLALDYPRFMTEEQLAAKKAAKEQEAKEAAKDAKDMGKDAAKDIAKEAAVKEGAKSAPVFAWPLVGEFCTFFFDLFGDFAFGFIVQLIAIGFAGFIAEKALEKHNSKSAVPNEEKSPIAKRDVAMDSVV